MVRPASRICSVGVAGPLAPFADAYEDELRRRGYSPFSAVNELRQVGRLSCWLDASRLARCLASRSSSSSASIAFVVTVDIARFRVCSCCWM